MSDHKANAEALDIALYGKPDIYTPPEEFMPRRAAITEKLAELYPDREGVDHNAEALRLIQFAQDSGSVSAATAAVAQATLALAKQQRIANLIAYNPVDPKYKSWNANNPPADLYVNTEAIREGLGL